MTIPEIRDFFRNFPDPENSQDLKKNIYIIHLARDTRGPIPVHVKYTTPNKYKSYIRTYKPVQRIGLKIHSDEQVSIYKHIYIYL